MLDVIVVRTLARTLAREVVLSGGAFLLSVGWHWHTGEHQLFLPAWVRLVAAALLLRVGYAAGRYAAVNGAERMFGPGLHPRAFGRWLDACWLLFSAVGGAYFLRDHLVRHDYLIGLIVIGLLLGYVGLRTVLPAGSGRTAIVAAVEVCLSIIVAQLLIQYVTHRYAIVALTPESWKHVVLRRTAVVSTLWMTTLAAAALALRWLPRWWRTLPPAAWWLCYTSWIFLGLLNIAIAFYSGLYFTPIVLDHIRGSGNVIFQPFTFGVFGIFFAVSALTLGLLRRYLRAMGDTRPRWRIASCTIGLVALAVGGVSGVWRDVPEYVVLASLADAWRGDRQAGAVAPQTFAKLERFGLDYQLNDFFVARRDRIYDPTAALVNRGTLGSARPNVIIIFWESFSSRLSEIYNSKLNNVTPGVQRMVDHPRTTLFRNYYNATTQTVTSLLSTLCSFLPPFGHEEVRQLQNLSRLKFSCLPQVLRQHGWGAGVYVTAVKKDFANKDSMLSSMGVTSLGTAELKRWIAGPPLSWGYSDHQLFPAFWEVIRQQSEPFLAMLSTIDSHAPYNLSRDAVPYGDGSNELLNATHSTDDAFRKFWEAFVASDLADRTMLVVVGDHPAYPSVLLQHAIQPEDGSTIGYYDETFLALYLPDANLPRVVDTYASSIDLTPTLLHLLSVNTPNVFEGHSIFDARARYPNLLGMDASGLYVNQLDAHGVRRVRYDLRHVLTCSPNAPAVSVLTLCELKEFFLWKRAMYARGRLFAP